MMSRSSRLLPLFFVLLLALACSEAPVSPDRPGPPDPSPDIVDAGHGTEAPGFYFLAPMADDPSATGTFDDGLAPVVTICEGAVTDCSSPVAEFTTTSGPDSETVRMVAEDEHYIVNWHTDAFDLDPELTYRIVVSVVPSDASEALVLGYADVAVASTGGELKNTDTGEEVPLKDGRTLPIKFRIETGIVGRLVVEPSQAEIEVDDTQSFTATLYDLHGSELTSPAVSWSSDDESVATVDASGLATGVSSGTAAITAASQRVSDSAELTVTTAGLSPTQVAKFLASDGSGFDFFGHSVALSGDVAVIGADSDDNDNGVGAGSAYVFERSDGIWSEESKLTASDGAAVDGFGSSVSMDDDVVVIGAPYDDDTGYRAGAAYVFERTSGGWVEVTKLTASDGYKGDHFGISVAVDGDVAVIGADDDDDNGRASGSAYVFERTSAGWAEVTKLTASDGADSDQFGLSVAMGGDVAVIGARRDDNVNGLEAGSAYVFERTSAGWTEVMKLTASDGAGGDFFGQSVAVSGDVAVIGAFGDDGKGSAYVFGHSGGGWDQVTKLMASDGAAGDRFGSSAAVDGNIVVIGAFGDEYNGLNAGSAYVFDGSSGSWTQAAKLMLTASDANANDFFGSSAAVDGGVALIGAQGDDNYGTNSGSAYVFDLRP